MRTRFRRRMTYANVMSTLALFVALGGSSYAAMKISGKSIERRSIPATKIERNSITGREVRESRLRVPRAQQAERLGGFSAAELRVRCPDDTFPTADVCVGTNPARRVLVWERGLRVLVVGTPAGPGPPLADSRRAHGRAGGGAAAPGGELTSDVYPSVATRAARRAVRDRRGRRRRLTPDTAAGGKAYRCVTDPLN